MKATTAHLSSVPAGMFHQSPTTHLLTQTLCKFPCRSVIQEAFYSPTFIYPSALSVLIPFPLFLPSLSFTGAPPPKTPAGHPLSCSPLPNIWHCCANSFQMPVHTGERSSFAQNQAFDCLLFDRLHFCSTLNQVVEQNACTIHHRGSLNNLKF